MTVALLLIAFLAAAATYHAVYALGMWLLDTYDRGKLRVYTK